MTKLAAFASHDHSACVSDALAAAEEQCRARHVQFTPVRRRVLELLLETHQALGAYDVLARLDAEGLGSQPPVAYRALGFLVDQGLAHRVERLNAFVACVHPGASHDPAFMICRSCHRVAEAEGAAPFGGDGGFHIERTMIEIEGLCPSCQDNGSSPEPGAGSAAGADAHMSRDTGTAEGAGGDAQGDSGQDAGHSVDRIRHRGGRA